ncbi:SH2 domain-containing protein 5 isoform X2 [Channa argus]|uniref:SH2 domain-containing protein 5 isoform X2 n=1 Tax=Channa argus TaxID=215402 RepID=UPI003521A131
MGEAPVREDYTVTRSAEYVGSFAVDDCPLDEQIEQLYTQMQLFKTCRKRRPVSLKFSIKGVKMYNEDETTLLMAHALRRVSLSTARPSDAQFAFVSHNPGSLDAQLYCHVFQARHARAAQFLNLLLCRCFQLSYIEKHPEEAQEESVSSLPRRTPSLLNHGFPLSVSALVSFRRAPFQGVLLGTKKRSKQRFQCKDPVCQAWPKQKKRWLKLCGVGPVSQHDVLGSYLICPHPKKPKCSSLTIRCPSGLITYLVANTRKGKFLLEKCKTEFSSIAELIDYYTETQDELPCLLSCARVNHCYEWEENTSRQAVKPNKSLHETKRRSTHRKDWV